MVLTHQRLPSFEIRRKVVVGEPNHPPGKLKVGVNKWSNAPTMAGGEDQPERENDRKGKKPPKPSSPKVLEQVLRGIALNHQDSPTLGQTARRVATKRSPNVTIFDKHLQHPLPS
jgi:hypothetical protein